MFSLSSPRNLLFIIFDLCFLLPDMMNSTRFSLPSIQRALIWSLIVLIRYMCAWPLMWGWVLNLGFLFLKSDLILPLRLWMSSSLRWRARRLTWRPCSWRSMLWRSWKMLRRTMSRDWRRCTKHRSLESLHPWLIHITRLCWHFLITRA